MDEDWIKGAATNIGGKVKDAVGGILGDSKTRAKGKADQASGQLQNAYGSAKDTVRESAETTGEQIDSFVKERPMVALLGAVSVGYVVAHLIHS